MKKISEMQRGFSLGGVMLGSLVLAVLVLGMTRLSVAHLWLSTRSNATLEASTLANSAASAAMAKLLERPTYGASDPDVVIENGRGQAIVTFSPERAELLSVPHSTNNLEGTTAREGHAGRPVAPGTALVIATCTFGGSQRTVEAVLKLPPFPWAIVAGGTLRTTESVLVGAIPAGQWPPPPDDELLPADILANASSSRSIVLSGDCEVLGDVESPGGIILEGGRVNVKGEVRPGVAPIEVPQLRAERYDPISMDIDFDDLLQVDSTAAEVPIQGAARKQGDFEVNGLRLQGAHLYVDGNLTVRGTVTGTGTLVCTGNIDILGMTLDAATELAVLADGRVNLRGSGQSASAVRGLFYAGDGLSARDLTVVGTVVAGNASAEVELENARVLSEPAPPAPVETSDGTVYVGEVIPLAPGQTGRPTANLSSVSSERPTYQYGFSLQVRHLNPETTYPVTVTVGPGFVTTQTRSWTLQSSGDFSRVVDFFANQFQNGVLDNRSVSLPRISTRNFFTNLLGNAVAPGGLAETGAAAVDLQGELSRFLPFEERVRIVSWIER